MRMRRCRHRRYRKHHPPLPEPETQPQPSLSPPDAPLPSRAHASAAAAAAAAAPRTGSIIVTLGATALTTLLGPGGQFGLGSALTQTLTQIQGGHPGFRNPLFAFALAYITPPSDIGKN